MNMGEVRKLAKAEGISSFGKTKVDLIRTIQRRQGYFDCYGTAVDFCDQMNCCFRDACFADARKAGHDHHVQKTA